MRFASSVAIAALAIDAASAIPVQSRTPTKTITVPVKRVSNVKSIKNVVEKGRARLRKANGESFAVGNEDDASGDVTNEDVTYVAPISIGGTTFSLIVDTGSSNVWTGAGTKYTPGSTASDTGNTFSVSYGSGSVSGEEYTDEVSFAGLTVTAQSFGAASTATGFSSVDGIIGFGPVDLTANTVSNTNEVPTFMDNLYSQGSISTEVLGVSFRPESGSDTDDTNGELTLGGTDSSKYTGDLTYFPVATSGDVASYWGIGINGFWYGSTTLASSGSGIVDTGTTLIYLPSTVYSALLSASGGSTDSSSGLVKYSTAPTEDFSVTFSSTTYSLTPDQYLVPTDQYSEYGLSSGSYYAFFADGGSSGVDTIIGQKFLENYYSVYDTTNSQIGFATAA